MKTATRTPSFDLGVIVATPDAVARMSRAGQTGFEFIRRHASCDWSGCNKEDTLENLFAVENGFRVFSVYKTRLDEEIWVITEADRSSTCILCPENY